MSAQPVARSGLRRYAAVLAMPDFKQSRETGSYAVAGAATGAFAICSGISAPLLGRLIDRLGQTPVLVTCALAFPASVAALLAVAEHHAHTVPVLACAAASGLCFPPLFATMRALISELAGGLTETAFALEAVVQELFFIGPLDYCWSSQ